MGEDAAMDSVFAARWSMMGVSPGAAGEQSDSLPSLPQYVWQHPNGLCIIGLTPSHPALKAESISSITYEQGCLNNQVSGKRKRGALSLRADDRLCVVTAGNEQYDVRAVVPGDLMELNDRLKTDASLLLRKPRSDGYLAIIRPHDKFGPKALAKLISWNDWDQEHSILVKEEQENSKLVNGQRVDCASGTTAQVDPE